jgi:xylulokinase
MENLIVLDLGTTGVKSALLDRSGRILAEDYRAYPMNVRGDRVEQDPEDWWESAIAVISSVAGHAGPGTVAGICLSGQMQDLVTLDARGSRGPAILYSDARARSEAATVERIIGMEELVHRTGNLQDATGLLAKIHWLRENDAGRYSASRRFLFGAHDYVAWRLTGTEATDYTTLSTTGLLDISANAYAWSVIDALGFDRRLFPSLVSAEHNDGGLLDEPARLIGVAAGTPVFHGAGDAGCTTVGSGAGVPGVTSCYLGTSGWLATTSTGGLVDPRTGIFNLRHPDPSSLIHVGPMLCAAGNVDWAIDAIGIAAQAVDRYASFTREAAAAAPGCGGLLYLPYLVGERSPFRDPGARGAFVGLSRSTGRADMYRAVLEGVPLP